MNILLIGATGRLGSRILAELIDRGHTVTGFARHPEALTFSHPHLRWVQGDVRDPAAVAAAMPGHDAVVTALGAARKQESRDVLSIGMANVIAGMQAHGLRRIVAIASAGILQRDAHSLRRDAPGYPEVFRSASAEHLKAYQALEASGLDYTVVCPPELVEGAREQPLVVQADYLPEGPKRVAMEALAQWVADELAAPHGLGRRIGMINAG